MDGSRRPRIADVAREAGVSKTAVSFAFNSPDRLAPDTAARIRAVAESLGYRPHPVARMLTQRHTLTLGVLTPQAMTVTFSDPGFWAFSEGVALVAEDSGYGLHFISPLHGSLARAVGQATVDGVLAIGLSVHHPEVEQIRQAGLPIVLVDSSALPDLPSVQVDDEGGARAAAEHLVALGHREFLIVAVEPERESARPVDAQSVAGRRLRGYRAALDDAGIELPAGRVMVGRASIDAGVAAFHRAWNDGLRPTAVLAMSDAVAVGVLRAAREVGLSIPDHVSVVGFDDVDLATHTDPPLTTIHQPIRRKGEDAARLLLAIVERRDVAEPEHRRLDTRLIVRGSSGPPPGPRREAGRVS